MTSSASRPSVKRRQLSMEVPVSLAIGGAFAASTWSTVFHGPEVYFDSVCMFAFFLLTSRYLEMGARHRAGAAADSAGEEETCHGKPRLGYPPCSWVPCSW